MKKIFYLLLLLIPTMLLGQVKVGNNPTVINPDAALEIEHPNKGVLITRVALTATNSAAPLSAFTAGMLVYNTATAGTAPNNVVPGFYYSDGAKWLRAVTSTTDQTVDVSGLGAGLTSPNSFAGASFSPNTPANTDVIYINTADGTTWTYNGSQYVSSPAGTGSTWYLLNSTIDAGNNKSSGVYRTGAVGIGSNMSPDPSAQLDVNSSSKGLLIPRLTTVQRDAMTSPATGIQIYNTDKNCLEYYNGSSWISTCGSSVNGTGNLSCTVAQPSGVYQVGYTTNSGNYITIPVTVVTAGSWTASTNSQNGISFTGGGVFSGPGQTNIILYATTGVNPATNGVFTYTVTLGASVCNFNIDFNSLPACDAPTPALTPTATVCAIPLNSSKTFTITGGTTNSTSFTYSITPTTGVSAPTGNVASGTTPSITFANSGNYTITYASTNSGSTCATSTITASQSFSVSNQAAAATATFCSTHPINTTNLPSSGSSFTTIIGGVSVGVTRSGTNTNTAFAVSGASCSGAVNTTASFGLIAGNASTFTFNQPVKDITFFGSADNADTYTITAMNGATNVSSLLVLSKLCPAQGFNISNCNQIVLSSNNTTGQCFNIGGVYFTSLTVTFNSGSDLEFDMGTCNASSNGCQAPTPALSATSAGPLNTGTSRAFTVSGGTTNATSFTYSITPTTGVSAPTGTVSSGTTPSITFTTTGTYTISFTATNTCGTGNPSSINTSYSFLVAPLAPAAATNTMCSAKVNAVVLPASGSTYTTTIAGVSTTITRSGFISNNSSGSGNFPCAGGNVSANCFNEASGKGNMTYTFSAPVSNISLFSGMDKNGDNLNITVSNNGVDVTGALTLTKMCPAQAFNINSNILSLSSNNSNGQAVNIGGVYFTSVTLNMPSGENIEYDFGVCNANTTFCTVPSTIIVTPSATQLYGPVAGGNNSITCTATGGTPNTSGLTWTVSPTTGITSATSGTGSTAALTFNATATGQAYTVSFSATNTGTTCDPITTTGSATVYVGMFRTGKEIQTANPSIASGSYFIDPDGSGSTFSPIKAYCDMTNDGGGWTLIAVTNGAGMVQANSIPTLSGSSYLARNTVIELASHCTDVTVRNSGSHTAPFSNKLISNNSSPINALKNASTAINGAGTWDGIVSSWNTTGSYIWARTCAGSANGWPNMYHACGTNNGVVFLGSDPSVNNIQRINNNWDATVSIWIR